MYLKPANTFVSGFISRHDLLGFMNPDLFGLILMMVLVTLAWHFTSLQASNIKQEKYSSWNKMSFKFYLHHQKHFYFAQGQTVQNSGRKNSMSGSFKIRSQADPKSLFVNQTIRKVIKKMDGTCYRTQAVDSIV